ncbi:MAG TPA: hypothetical protein V6C88_19460 [Chroococcidiopsis sp.]
MPPSQAIAIPPNPSPMAIAISPSVVQSHAVLRRTLLGAISLAIALTSCSSGPSRPCFWGWPGQHHSIQTVLQSPAADCTVAIQGQVGDRAPLIGAQVYQLTDSTGEIWVLTRDPVQPLGETVNVRGIVRVERVLVNGQDRREVYIEEQNRQHQNP